MGIIIERYINNNSKNNSYGKMYGRVKKQGKAVDIRALATHVQKHGSIYTYDTIVGVLAKMEQCLPELILQGRKVKLAGLGTFYLSASTNGEENAADFTVDSIKKLHLRFLPDRANYSIVASGVVTRSGLTEGISVTDYYVQEGAKDLTTGKQKRVIVFDRGESVSQTQNGSNTNSGSNSGASNTGGGSNSGGTTTGGDEPGEDRP